MLEVFVVSSSDMSMSSTSLLSFSSLVRWLRPNPWKGDSEPEGEGASSEGEGTGDSTSGSVAFKASSLRFRLDTRFANVLYAWAKSERHVQQWGSVLKFAIR